MKTDFESRIAAGRRGARCSLAIYRGSAVEHRPASRRSTRRASGCDLGEPDHGAEAERSQQHQRAEPLHRHEGHRARARSPSCASCRGSSPD